VRVAPLDWTRDWVYPWSRMAELAELAGLEVEDLRAYLEREVVRRRARSEWMIVTEPA
jgi:hypothetical protein